MRALGATLLALALPASSAAALEIKLAVVQVRPYWTYLRPDGSCCRLVAANVKYPFKVEAVSPAGRVYRVAVRKTKNRYVWAGWFVFRSPGRWIVRDPQWGPSYSTHFGAKPRIRVLVKQ